MKNWTSLFKVVNVLLHNILNKIILKIFFKVVAIYNHKDCVMKINYVVNIPFST